MALDSSTLIIAAVVIGLIILAGAIFGYVVYRSTRRPPQAGAPRDASAPTLHSTPLPSAPPPPSTPRQRAPGGADDQTQTGTRAAPAARPPSAPPAASPAASRHPHRPKGDRPRFRRRRLHYPPKMFVSAPITRRKPTSSNGIPCWCMHIWIPRWRRCKRMPPATKKRWAAPHARRRAARPRTSRVAPRSHCCRNVRVSSSTRSGSRSNGSKICTVTSFGCGPSNRRLAWRAMPRSRFSLGL